MNKIIKQILKGGGKTTSYILAALFAFALAETAWAAKAMFWAGEGSSYNPTAANNWKSGTPSDGNRDGYFVRWGQQNYPNRSFFNCNGTFNLGSTNFWVDGNSSSSHPFEFRAYSKDSNGMKTTGNLYIGYADSSYGYGSGYLKIVNGTYNIAKCYIGSKVTTKDYSGHLVFNPGDNNGTVNFSSDLTLYNGKMEATKANVTISGIVNLGYSDNGKAEFVLNSGTWKTARLWMSRNNNDVAKLYVKGGTLQMTGSGSNGRIYVGATTGVSTNYVEISGGTVDCSSADYFTLGYNGNANSRSELVVKGGTLKCKDLYVGDGSSAKATISGGMIDAQTSWIYFAKNTGCAADEFCELNVNGGTIFVKKLTYGSGSAPATLNLNGGTLKAVQNQADFINESPNLTVNVGPNGGTINANGKSITVLEPLLAATGSNGGMTFTGGGTVTLSATPTYTGVTTLDIGTTLALGSRAFLDAASFGGITVNLTDLGANTTYDILKGTNGVEFTSADFAKITFSSEIPASVAYLELHTTTTANDTIRLVVGGSKLIPVDNGGKTTLSLSGNDTLCGVGGIKLSSLSLPANGTLTLDPIKTPVYVSAAPTFGGGAKLALAADYAGMSLGRIVLLTWAGEATLPENLNSLFDATSIASGATFAVTTETAPNGDSTQLVLTVGDYENDAKEIRITSIGDSITQGVASTDKGASGQSDYPQYRTDIAARLAANGYKPKMIGVWKLYPWDAAGILLPEDWIWHSGISGDRIMTGGVRGGVRDNLHVFFDIAGDVNAVTLLIGTNDLGNGKTVEETYIAYTNLVFEMAAERPGAKIFGSTILDRNDGTGTVNHDNVVQFNTLLKADYAAGNLPANFVMLDLFEDIPLTTGACGNFLSDNLHMNWAGCAVASEKFAEAIMTVLPLTGANAITGDPDPTVTDVPQAALGATNTVPAAYREGMTHFFTIDAPNAVNGFTSAPYTTTNNVVSVNRSVTKAGYYMELVRKGTSRRRYVWVDFDATGKTLDEIDFPWDGANLDFVAEKLHVYSNDPSIHIVAADDDTIIGAVEGTHYNYSSGDNPSGKDARVPADIILNGNNVPQMGWNDTLGSANGYGCFQAHRIFSQTGTDTHWNDAEVLFAWNAWGSTKSTAVDDIGIGSFAKDGNLGGGASMDYTWANEGSNGAADTISSSAYQVRHLEIWATVDMPAEMTHGKWIGGAGPNMSTPGNWEDNLAPVAGDALDFSLVTSATTINGDIDATFGAVTMGTGVITFTGGVKATSFSNTAKITVGADSTVTLDGNLSMNDQPTSQIVNKVNAGGRFIVTGKIVSTGKNIEVVNEAGSGYIVAGGVEINGDGKWLYTTLDKTSQNWAFGAQGITGTGSVWCRSNSLNDSYFYAYTNDFHISTWTVIRDAIDHHELNTTGFGDGLPHTITLDAGFADRGALYIAGTGKVVVNCEPLNGTLGGYGAYSGNVTVKDSATLAINAGKKLTTGTTTFAAGTTLEVPSTGVEMGALAFSGTGTVTLKVAGTALAEGEYTLLTSATVGTSDDVLTHFTLDASAVSGGETAWLFRSGNAIKLCIGREKTYYGYGIWCGGTDAKLSTAANWKNGIVPRVGDALDFSGLSADNAVNADLDLVFGTVTMGAKVVTFNGNFAATSFTDTSKIAVAANSTVTLDGDWINTRNSTAYVTYTIGEGGAFIVTGALGIAVGGGNVIPQNKEAAGPGVIVVGRIVNDSSTDRWIYTTSDKQTDHVQTWIIGPDGIDGANTNGGLWMYSSTKATTEIRPNTNDFTIALKTVFRENANQLTLDTTGWGDNAGHTVTLDGDFYDSGSPFVIKGTGKVVVNHYNTANFGGKAPYSGALQVNDTATLAINAGMRLTTGAITVNTNATLQVAESGTVELGGNMNLLGATPHLAFHYTNRNAPKLDLAGKTVTFEEGATIKVKISAESDLARGRGPQNILTSGFDFTGVNVELESGHPDWVTGVAVNSDGNIVLTVKPLMTMILVK